MPESAFTVTFGGTPDTGRLAVRDLAPALLALGELIADASVLLDPDREPAALSIESIDVCPATVRLVVSTGDRADRLTDLLALDASTVLSEIHDVVIGPRGILQLARHVRNDVIAERAATDEPGITRVALRDNETFEVRDEALELYLHRGARRNAAALIRPLTSAGLKTLKLASAITQPTQITALDVDALGLPTTPEPGPVESELEMLVDVAAPAFPVNNKWRLSNGTAGSFWATIGDGAFLNRVNAGEPFRKGDSLRCLFTVTRRETTLGPQTEHHVTKVLQHVARGQQLRLDEAE
jgi:hypothetical protein